jgi:tetratricopeptide (TPR) repeat protein
MRLMKTYTLVVLLLVLGLGACSYHSARDEFDRQIAICSLAEDNGLLDEAVEACGTALAIAGEQAYAPGLVSGLLYRLGRLQRQRGNFIEAETLTRRSLALEEQSGEQGAVASRLVELSFSTAGQGRWLDGAQLLQRALPLVDDLTGQERKAAANAFRMFSMRLGMLGHTEQAEHFKVKAQELAEL